MKKQKRKWVSFVVTICLLFSIVNPAVYAQGAGNIDSYFTGDNALPVTYYVGGGTGTTSGTIGESSEYPFATLYDAMQVVNQKGGNYSIIIQGNTTENKAIVIGDGSSTVNVVISNFSAVSGSAISVSGSAVSGSATSGSTASGGAVSGGTVSGGAASASTGTGFTITSAVTDGCLISVSNNATLTLVGNTDTTAGLTLNGSSNASHSMFYINKEGTLKLLSGIMLKNNDTTNKSPDPYDVSTYCACITNKGHLFMEGGIISGNVGNAYGGVFNEGIFTMSGGTITDNSGNNSGGVYNMGTFEMSGGDISINHSSCAESVYNTDYGKFCFTGGSIVYDPSSYAAIYVMGAFTMSGGAVITGTNDTKDIYLLNTATVKIGNNLTADDHISLKLGIYSPDIAVLSGNAEIIKNNYSKFSLEASQPNYSIRDTGTLEYHGTTKTFYVDGTVGSDINPGTLNAPFATIEKAKLEISKGGNVGTIYICSDINITAPVIIWGTITIKNYGEKHTLLRSGNFDNYMFIVYGSLTLGDSDRDPSDYTYNLALDGNNLKNRGCIIYNSGFLKLYSGAVIQNGATTDYGGVLNGGNFIMYGGSISHNSGGGVHNCTSATFIMQEGSITDNTSFSGGGVCNEGTFIMEGGNISNNSAFYKGNGVYCMRGTFTIKDDAVISNNNDVYLSNEDTIVTIGGKLLGTAPVITINTKYKNGKLNPGNPIIISGGGYNFTAEDLAKITLSDSRYFLNSAGVINAELKDSYIDINPYSNNYYTGSVIKPSVSVILDKTLKEGTDYIVSYENNTNAGTATVTVEGLGNYCGKVTKTFQIKKAVIERITTAAPAIQTFKASEDISKAELLASIKLSEVDTVFPGNTAKLPITWKLVNGTYNPKGGTYTYEGTPTGNNNIDAGNARLITKILVTAAMLSKPSFTNIVIPKGTNAKANSGDLGSSILPVSGSSLVDGKTIKYKIDWGNQTLDTTVPEESTTFTGTITYTDAPDWVTLPSDLKVKRTVSVAAATSFTINVSAGNNGSITPNGSVIVNKNADQSFTIIPFPGCSISDVLVDGNSVGAVSSFTFTKVTKNHSISASFITPIPAPAVEPTVTQQPTVAPMPKADKVKEIQADVSVKVEQDKEGDELNNSITISEEKILDMIGTGDTSEKTKITIPVSSTELTQQIKDSKASKTNIDVTVPNSLLNNDSITGCDIVLDSDIIGAAKDTRKDITVAVQNEKGSEMYSWTFKKNDLADSDKPIADINLSLKVEKAENNTELSNLLEQGAQSGNDSSNSLVINFSHHGDLPSQANVKINVGDMGFTVGQTLYLYYYNSETGKLETLPHTSDIKVDSDGYVSVNIVHCSEYVLMPQKVSGGKITSLLNQINVTPKKTTLYLEGTDDSTASINISLPSTLELVEDLKDKTSGNAVGAVTVSYQSSNKKIVVVSNKGKITAKGTGKAVITATVKLYSGKTRNIKVKVTVKNN